MAGLHLTSRPGRNVGWSPESRVDSGIRTHRRCSFLPLTLLANQGT